MTRLMTFLLLVAPEASSGLDHELGEFNLFLFCFLVVGLVGMAVQIGIGVVTGICMAAIGGGMVISSAALSALIAATASRNPWTGLKWFVVQLSLAGGALSGLVIGLIYSYLHGIPAWNWQCSGLSALLGAGVSAVIGWAALKFWLKAWNQIHQRWRRHTPDSINHDVSSENHNP